MHLVGLDLGQGGTGTGPSGASLQPGNPWAEREAKQIAWLKADLAAVDRAVTLELGRIIALYCRSSTLYQIHEQIRCFYI